MMSNFGKPIYLPKNRFHLWMFPNLSKGMKKNVGNLLSGFEASENLFLKKTLRPCPKLKRNVFYQIKCPFSNFSFIVNKTTNTF